MRIKLGYELIFNYPAPVVTLMYLYVHPDQAHVLQQPEYIVLDPPVPIHNFTDNFGNRVARIVAPAGQLRITYSNVAWSNGEPEPSIEGAILQPLHELPDQVFQYLLPSRYCESDKLSEMAWNLFGNTPMTWERVKAIVDWSHRQITFGYQWARNTRTAAESVDERVGVCRDYMHLAVALLRAMNIPARYATGYLGDIGVPYNPAPMDFSAYLEVFLSGRWWAMDARHNAQRIGRIKQAHGRDAADVALTTSFGPAYLQKFWVETYEIHE